jgi:hypothetical protein
MADRPRGSDGRAFRGREIRIAVQLRIDANSDPGLLTIQDQF